MREFTPLRVSVIIPTTLTQQRWRLLERLLLSLRGEGAAQTIVVVNGTGIDSAALAALRAMPEIEILEFGAIGVLKARYEGRLRANGDLIQFIDDDDELFPGALAARQAEFHRQNVLMVASDGVLVRDDREQPFPTGGVARISDPPLSILQENWNGTAVCAMYRREAVSEERMWSLPVMEWTVLGFLIAQQPGAIRFLQVPQYRINDTPGSLSREGWYLRGEIDALEYMRGATKREDLIREIEKKLLLARHHLACRELDDGRRWAAWRLHLAVLIQPGGHRFWRFTARLLWPWLPMRA